MRDLEVDKVFEVARKDPMTPIIVDYRPGGKVTYELVQIDPVGKLKVPIVTNTGKD